MKESCSFCGTVSRRLVLGPKLDDNQLYICESCTSACYDAFNVKEETSTKSKKIKSPEEIYEHLSKHVIGQEEAKKTLSVAMYNHLKRVYKLNDNSVDKSNVLLIGPSGCGKTLLISSLAELLDLPVTYEDATTFTEVGYVGKDADIMIKNLLSKAGGDVELAQRGIVFVDEVDKLSRKKNTSTRDVGGEGTQQSMLRLIEGTDVRIESQTGQITFVNTSNILFIFSGAFEGLEKVIENNKNGSSIGFGGKPTSLQETSLSSATEDDLVSYGLIKEFVGRIPVKATLNKLSVDDLVKITIEPQKSIIKQYKSLFKLDKIDLDFSDDYLKVIAEKALLHNTGARGIRSEIEKLLLDTQFKLPTYAKSGVTKMLINNDGSITMEYKKIEEKRTRKNNSNVA
jgi:ATP-dependent Clp protease ATP-binding subunit ClpX